MENKKILIRNLFLLFSETKKKCIFPSDQTPYSQNYIQQKPKNCFKIKLYCFKLILSKLIFSSFFMSDLVISSFFPGKIIKNYLY